MGKAEQIQQGQKIVRAGKMINRVSTQIHDDGLCASERNISSISRNNDAVVVILQGSEMQDKKVHYHIKRIRQIANRYIPHTIPATREGAESIALKSF